MDTPLEFVTILSDSVDVVNSDQQINMVQWLKMLALIVEDFKEARGTDKSSFLD